LRQTTGTGIPGTRERHGAQPRKASEELAMTNRIALVLGTGLVILIAVDLLVYGSDHMIFLGKKMADLIEWLAFWR
jgi:hypothetical protein